MIKIDREVRKYRAEAESESWADKLRGKLVKLELFTKRDEDPMEVVGKFISKPRDIILNDYVTTNCKGDVLERGDFIMIREGLWKIMRCKSMASI